MYDVVVVGAGVMGSATAYWLSRAGKRVALLEQFSPAHVRASSADESRTIRYQYRGQAAYTRMVAGAVELWKEFDRQSGTDFYRETGTLTLQTQPDFEPLLDGFQGLCDLGYTPRWLDASDIRREFPQFANVDSGYIMEGVGGYIAAGPATRALAEAAAEQGADVLTGAEVVEFRESGGRVTSVVTRDGRAFDGDVIVITAGPWTARLLPNLPVRVQPTAARLHYLKPEDPVPTSIRVSRPFSVMDTQFYGFPVHWRGCVKVADDMIGEPFDPDRDREHEDPGGPGQAPRLSGSPHAGPSRRRGRLQQDLHLLDDPGLGLHHRPRAEPRQRPRGGRLFRARLQVRHPDRADHGRPGDPRHDRNGTWAASG